MKDKIATILKELKAKKIPASRVEKELGFSNGLLKKAANGTKLSLDKLEKLVQYHDIKMHPTVDNGDGSITVRDKDLIPFLREHHANADNHIYRNDNHIVQPLTDLIKNPEFMKFTKNNPDYGTKEGDYSLEENWAIKDGKKVPITAPATLPKWVQKIEDYCGIAGITPEELIEQHAMRGAKKTMIEVPKEEKKKDPIQVKGKYDPFKNPKFMKLHGAQKEEKSPE